MKNAKFLTVIFMFLFLAGVCSTPAKTTTWTGAGQNWNEAFWSAGSPADGDDVIINGNVVLTNSTPFLNSYTNNAGMTHTFGGTNTILYATNATIYGTITHYASTATNGIVGVYISWTNDNRVFIVCSNLTVAGGGKIDATGKGYGANAVTHLGNGPGGGNAFWGGSYGGDGDQASGRLYGSTNAPEDPGSGGGGWTGAGGLGGGAIRIDASGTVVVNGTINADGTSTGDSYAGGSGGAVYITCRIFDGTNAVSAKGGNGGGTTGWAGGGGGGRIAILYNTNAQVSVPAVRFSVAGGTDGSVYGDIGTLYFPNNLFLTETIIHSGQWMGQPLLTNWSPNNLVISNGWIRFPSEGFQLTVTNGLTVRGTDLKLNKLELKSAVLACGGNILLTNGSLVLYRSESVGPTVNCGGNLLLASARLSVYAVGTNIVPLPGYGALVSVTGDVSIASCWVYPYSHPTNGGSVLFRMRNLTITGGANGGFNADFNGFIYGTGSAPGAGRGPGARTNGLCGAGYGGAGGSDGGAGAGLTYGSPAAPIEPGSGGAGAGYRGGWGGGAVRIEARGAVTNNGTITAQGGTGATGGGGGSGGGVYILCGSFAGTGGVIQADGSISASSGGSGGGGGRIALLYTNTAAQDLLPIPDVRFSAAGGTSYGRGGYTGCGNPGTLYFSDNRFLVETFRHAGQWMGQPMLTSWAPTNLVISNGWLKFPTDGFQLRVTNDITVMGTDPYLHRLELTNGVLICGGNFNMNNASLMLYGGATSGPTLTCGSAMGVTNGAKFNIYSGPTNSMGPNYGALVTVAGLLTITNAWIYPYSQPTNGGSVLFRLGSLTISGTNGGFDARAKGFQVGYGPGKGTLTGGGGYGGIGGDTGGGQTYGSSNAPVDAGSGATAVNNGFGINGAGGGSVRLQVTRTFQCDGSILASGEDKNGLYAYGAGGAGGGVYITCRTFSGNNGVIYATGGKGNGYSSAGIGGGGGGGRIAIWSVKDTFSGTLTAPPGGTTTINAHDGAVGTLVRGLLPAPGTIISVY